MTVTWTWKKFSELSPFELYNLLQLRSEVFVVEQNCVFLDMDNRDQHCFHLMGCMENMLVAYARIVPPGTIYKEASIGRVVTSPSVRKKGVGKLLMQKAIAICSELFGNSTIRIGAQFYLKNFYGSLGFNQVGDVYLEDGIEHIYMLKDAST